MLLVTALLLRPLWLSSTIEAIARDGAGFGNRRRGRPPVPNNAGLFAPKRRYSGGMKTPRFSLRRPLNGCIRLATAAALTSLFLQADAAFARVESVEVERRETILEGRPFGDAGAYEKIDGRIRFAFDPASPFNQRIVDLEFAPRDEDSLVRAEANFMVLQPVDPAKRRGVALLEVSNRGGKAALGYFNDAAFSLDPTDPEHFGDGLLLRQGLTIIWIGWQWDVRPLEHRLRLEAPIARRPDAEPITGLVRADWVLTEPRASLHLGHRGHIAYEAIDPDDPRHTLTVRDGRDEPRRVIPRDRWRFARENEEGEVVPDRAHVHMPSGFKAGKIYELVYVSKDPRVAGLGPAALRDAAAYIKGGDALFPADHVVAFGVSQTGRFLRTFLYHGFNTTEDAEQAFDGMLIHTAGAGRGSFNHRFAQPSRDAHRFSAFLYPTDIFPFTTRTLRDPLTLDADGLATHALDAAHLPKVFATNTGYEYWGRASALIHIHPSGARDAEPHPNERLYHIASAQHFRGRPFPPDERQRLPHADAYRNNALDLLIPLRALLVALVEWVETGSAPPPSAVPALADGTLVPLGEIGWPRIPGLATPDRAHTAHRVDYGARWEEGIVTIQPPFVGPAFPVRVPSVDRFGNERGGVPTLEIEAPLATYLPWALRTGMPGPEEELADFWGTYAPLPLTERRKRETRDGRPSVESLYEDRTAYERAAREAAERLVRRRWMLEEDVERAVERAMRHWDWLHERE